MFEYCPKCYGTGFRIALDSNNDIIRNYCDFYKCKHAKELKFKIEHPILDCIKNTAIFKFIDKWFYKLTSEYLWSDIKYFIRKVIRFFKRVYEWRNILFHDEEFCSSYLINIIEFKLLKYEKALREDKWHKDADLRADEIRVALNYLDRYRNIEKYTESDEHNTWTEPIFEEDGTVKYYHMKSDQTPEGKRKFKKQMDTEEMNHSEFWNYLAKKYRRWST